MNSRQRVIAAIEHRETDRVPVDIGGSIMSGIMAQPLTALRRHLGLEDRPVKVYEIFQMLGEMEPDIIECLGIDVLPVEPEAIFFGLKREKYKPWRLFDGTEVLVPGQFNVEEDAEGNWLLHEEGDPAQPVAGRMPKNGYYFDLVGDQQLHADFTPPTLQELEEDYLTPISAQRLDYLAAKAERLRPTGKALFLGDWSAFGPPWIGNTPDWLCLLASDPEYVDQAFALRTEGVLRNLELLRCAIGDNIDILGVDGQDFGTQKSEMFSPEFFARYHLPFYLAVNGWVHAHTPWKTWKHTCGSNAQFMPMYVEGGLDCLNPMQRSAAGMDLAVLKREYGSRITFWGGGVDTQHTLPFGTPEEVYREVLETIRLLSAGGGFVFNTVHNIQANVPVENLAAMFQAIRDSY